jgi:hypothetical protein
VWEGWWLPLVGLLREFLNCPCLTLFCLLVRLVSRCVWSG